MLPATLVNPFAVQKLDDTVTLPPGDVADLHQHVLVKCQNAIQQVRHTRHSLGLLVVGEAGSGKSHLIAQVRRKLALDQHAVLAAIGLRGAFGGRLWRHMRRQLVDELLRPYPDKSHGENGLVRILRNQFPNWASKAQGQGGLFSILLGSPSSTETLRQSLANFEKECLLDYSFARVLPKLTTPDLNQLAGRWLRGEHLAQQDLARLELPLVDVTELEQENMAREVVISILRLAGDKTTVFLCFDEVEAIQQGTHDVASLQEFCALATDVLAQSGPRVVATFIRPNLQVALDKAVEHSNIQKMGQETAQIPPLSWEQAVQVVRFRLQAEPTCRAARKEFPANADWPFGETFVRQTYQANKLTLTPRHLLIASQVEFERLKKGEPPVPPGLKDPKLEPPPDDLSRRWESKRKGYSSRPQSLQFDKVMAIGLPWLLDLTQASLVHVPAKDKTIGDVDLLFHAKRGHKRVGICLCNQEPSQLWRRLDRIIKQWTSAKSSELSVLIILRSADEKMSPGVQTRLTNLQHAGARLVFVQLQQLTELAAFQSMLTATVSGELTRNGKPIEAAEFNAWAANNLSGAVKELLHQIFDTDASAPAAAKPAKVAAAASVK